MIKNKEVKKRKKFKNYEDEIWELYWLFLLLKYYFLGHLEKKHEYCPELPSHASFFYPIRTLCILFHKIKKIWELS